MELILIDLTKDKPRKVGSFTVTKQVLKNKFIEIMSKHISNLLNIPSSTIEILSLEEDQDPFLAFEHYLQCNIIIKNTINKYTIIPT